MPHVCSAPLTFVGAAKFGVRRQRRDSACSAASIPAHLVILRVRSPRSPACCLVSIASVVLIAARVQRAKLAKGQGRCTPITTYGVPCTASCGHGVPRLSYPALSTACKLCPRCTSHPRHSASCWFCRTPVLPATHAPRSGCPVQGEYVGQPIACRARSAPTHLTADRTATTRPFLAEHADTRSTFGTSTALSARHGTPQSSPASAVVTRVRSWHDAADLRTCSHKARSRCLSFLFWFCCFCSCSVRFFASIHDQSTNHKSMYQMMFVSRGERKIVSIHTSSYSMQIVSQHWFG